VQREELSVDLADKSSALRKALEENEFLKEKLNAARVEVEKMNIIRLS